MRIVTLTQAPAEAAMEADNKFASVQERTDAQEAISRDDCLVSALEG
jgi:hypothetical protein